MKLTTLALTGILVAATASPVLAENVAAGRDGWGYDSRAETLVGQLRGDWQVTNHSGSEDIAREVCADNDTPIGIAQIDAIYQMQVEGCDLVPLGIYPSQEFALMMFPPDGYNELDDFREGARILVGEAGSGSALFWRTIVSIENGEHGNQSRWSKSEPVYSAFALANTLASVGDVDAALLVTSADAQIIQDLLNAGWTVGELDDKDIDDFQFRRGSLYERSSIEIDDPTSYWNINQDAVEVRSYWIGNPEWVTENQGQLSRIASLIASIR